MKRHYLLLFLLLVVQASSAQVDIKQDRPTGTTYQLPILVKPANGAELEAHIAQQMITFRWTSLVPVYPELLNYRVQVFEILPGQTPMQAFRGNRPVLNEFAIKGTTQYIWRPNLAMLDSTANRQFIWTVQTLNTKGVPVPARDGNVQGRSQPTVFSIIRKKSTADDKKN